ncbi:hypothetical protein [Flavivirga rizhaonensis]|uniref:Uncharacterized protein n=1 Tax=Flavivirga rizhaonensis TaxID=2559571 RepID=A0A4S1DVK5_9FLAO|nr:hypothetical protein [Flavivirga rizhaonensis]TGV02136.1 hypothetical protein EM932_12270 [Flavivirga rizhaonensis]
MKKQVSLLFCTLCTALFLNAQDQTINGATFKQDGKVGVGTTSPNHELTVEGASSPNIELKNSNYSNGGFVLNRTNYGHQWKWWAQHNVMYFDFSTDETNYSNKFTIKSNAYVGIGAPNPLERLHIGNTFTFHDGGHKVLGIMYAPSGGVDLSNTQYSSELRFDPNSGILGLGTSSSITSNPTSHLL